MIRIDTKVSIAGVVPTELIARLGPEDRNRAAASTVAVLVRKHLTGYNAQHPNELGGKRTNHYRQLAQSTTWVASASEGFVTIEDYRARQTIMGGLIRPGKGVSFKTGKPTRALAIPAHSESYGERPQKFDGQTAAIYFKVPHGKLLGMIVDRGFKRLAAGKERREGAITGGKLSERGVFKFKRVLYWLMSEVNPKGRPDAIPSRQEIVDTAVGGVRTLVKLVLRNTPGTAVVWGS